MTDEPQPAVGQVWQLKATQKTVVVTRVGERFVESLDPRENSRNRKVSNTTSDFFNLYEFVADEVDLDHFPFLDLRVPEPRQIWRDRHGQGEEIRIVAVNNGHVTYMHETGSSRGLQGHRRLGVDFALHWTRR